MLLNACFHTSYTLQNLPHTSICEENDSISKTSYSPITQSLGYLATC
jgi:hypothetical protein